ncbi:hypothetical protein CQA53_08845 [Helicobacter didelphidarum]|uniref:Phage terminase large subunit N-terminal domain-containing protein n=1 Tax=Helicobacter didelphidarum TaxID=2040648 RepID=A0A3D8ICM6_9HELI|nr:phage terminase large subunit [Helicobacter didelphidarum]RDU62917.1 hypothetical protein CQA53_08845 [Helicobacter didelphidarum]
MKQHIKAKVLKPFIPLFKGDLKGYRELIYSSGRGMGKTKQIVQYGFFRCLEKKTFVLCLRKYEKSQKYSLITEFRELIESFRIQTQEQEYTLYNENVLDLIA